MRKNDRLTMVDIFFHLGKDVQNRFHFTLCSQVGPRTVSVNRSCSVLSGSAQCHHNQTSDTRQDLVCTNN